MNMHWVDWAIMAALMGLLLVTVLATRKYMQGVSDFLAAGRCGGRYLLSIGEGIAGLGAITVLAFWEMYYKGGFTAVWWTLPQWPLLFILAMSGWVLYRFRQTRSLTMAQFLEMRYSRRFRMFTGVICFLSGVINYGVFPGINARFFIYFCGLPDTFELAGLTIQTFPALMVGLLAVALYFTFTGGQIAIMLTNFMQGVFCMVVMLVCCATLFEKVGWDVVSQGLDKAPAGQSYVNPFDIGDIEGFNVWFFLIQYFIWVYVWKAWQGAQGYNTSAKTPHEARMAQILGTWRYFSQDMLIPIFAIVAIAVVGYAGSDPYLLGIGDGVRNDLATIDNRYFSNQMTVPLVLSRLLPIGLMGGLAAVMLAAAVSTDQSYLHSWGSIFIQDVVMPFRNKPLGSRQHIWLLRLSIFGVAIFAFFFSYNFSMKDYIRMFFAQTGAIYLGGAGTCIIGGLYTRRGTAAGAWGAMITGALLAFTGIMSQQIARANPDIPGYMLSLQGFLYEYEWLRVPIDLVGHLSGQVQTFYNAMCCITVYTVLSLVTGWRWKFNLDRMLHRGQYAVQEDVVRGDTGPRSKVWKWLGINESFTRWDRGIYIGSVVWIFLWGAFFAGGTIYHFAFQEISDAAWISLWYVIVWISLGLGCVVTVWFLIGGLRDMKEMFYLLRTRVRDVDDDGRVRDDYGDE